MSSILCLNEDILKLIYAGLNLRDKFTFTLVNKKIHDIFNDYPLLDTVLQVNNKYYMNATFLFKNVIIIEVLSETINNQYIAKFKNLKALIVSIMKDMDFGKIKNLTYHLPDSLERIYSHNKDFKELFELVIYVHSKGHIVKFKEAAAKGTIRESSCKRLRPPSSVRDIFNQELKLLLLYKNRLKYATFVPKDFLPHIIFEKFPQLSQVYQVVIDYQPFDKNMLSNKQTIVVAIEKLKELLIHSIVISQQSNWIFVTQVEVYYKDKDVDDVATTSKLDQYPDRLTITMEKFQEGRVIWRELRFVFDKFEIIVTGGLCNHTKDDKLNAFLGVAAPPRVAFDDKFILFSPLQAANTVLCPRMLRNYAKKASLNPWCIKSSFLCSLNFNAPGPLKLFETEPLGYVSICSKLLSLMSFKSFSSNDVQSFVVLDHHLFNQNAFVATV